MQVPEGLNVKFSCIMTAFNEGAIMRQSVMSVLSQTYANLELIIVDDGSGEKTKTLLAEFDDPRVKLIPQANDGLSSARNRGLQHASGDYICFLDADDVRAPWCFATVAKAIERTGSELVMLPGIFSGSPCRLEPFFDSSSFEVFAAEEKENGSDDLARRKAWATSFEPQSANKVISRSLLDRGQLRFPNDHFFEDILFHAMCIAHARSIEIMDTPGFTYFQRMLHRQTTGSNGTIRFDIIGVARVTLQMFQAHCDFINARQRGALILNVLRLLHWCEGQAPHFHVWAFRVALSEAFRDLDSDYFNIPADAPSTKDDRNLLLQYAREVIF